MATRKYIPMILLAFGAAAAPAQEEAAKEAAIEEKAPEQCVMLIEPKLLAGGSELFRSIPGAKRTGWVPGRETAYGGIEYHDRESFAKLGLRWEEFLERARDSAGRLLATLEPAYVRDHREVIQYAVLRSKSQRTAGVILARKFGERFRKTLGDELVVVIPDRYTVVVFPKIAGDYTESAGAIVERYEDAVYPVSLEVFGMNRGENCG